jgi:signal transduction histidine kinase
MSLGLEAVQDLLPDNPSAEDVMIRLREEMRSTIGELRRVLAGLQPGVLEERGLAEALRHRAKTAAHAGGLAVAVTVPESLPPLAGELEVAAYRIADEALTNIVRHAQAQHASITVTIADAVRLEICDDGRGPPSTQTNGVGLSSMRRRTEELGGQFLLEASQTGGTRVVATLPRGT